MHESDRGCALFAAAYLDMALGKLLRACFVQSNKLNEDLFVGQNPLSTFSPMTKFAFYLGKISASERKDLDTIRLIRNELAHNAKKLTFTDQAINMRCGNLVHNSRDKGAQPRSKFIGTVSSLLGRIQGEASKTDAATELIGVPIT